MKSPSELSEVVEVIDTENPKAFMASQKFHLVGQQSPDAYNERGCDDIVSSSFSHHPLFVLVHIHIHILILILVLVVVQRSRRTWRDAREFRATSQIAHLYNTPNLYTNSYSKSSQQLLQLQQLCLYKRGPRHTWQDEEDVKFPSPASNDERTDLV
ncbi:hypothetical protein M0804_014549 [Polistes exclamans]|nr:hypothetical protein M0804_014550 [Polistes exclamans]KAI4475025.1 hypothetical protein M0804_014549 [Polistes exclamans]